MDHLKANTDDSASKEKHVPVYMVEGNKVCIKVGETLHPSEEKHYIKEIVLKTNKGLYRRYLSPNTKPEVCFTLDKDENVEKVSAYCSIHGLWETNS